MKVAVPHVIVDMETLQSACSDVSVIIPVMQLPKVKPRVVVEPPVFSNGVQNREHPLQLIRSVAQTYRLPHRVQAGVYQHLRVIFINLVNLHNV